MGEVTLIVFAGDLVQTLPRWHLAKGMKYYKSRVWKNQQKLEACKNTLTGHINTRVLVRETHQNLE